MLRCKINSKIFPSFIVIFFAIFFKTSFASGEDPGNSLCNIYQILVGNDMGIIKALALLSIAYLGFLFFVNKVQPTTVFFICAGFSFVFGAPTLMSVLTGVTPGTIICGPRQADAGGELGEGGTEDDTTTDTGGG